MRIQCYENGDHRIHVDREDDGTFIGASLLTNPTKGFRRHVARIDDETALADQLSTGYVKTFEKRV